MRILFATSNPHKISEVRRILEPSGFQVLGLDSLPGDFVEPEEDADTFAQNARLKARGYAAQTGRRCLAEDSGLEVDALQGAPGVYSARYAGTTGTREQRDRRNNDKLLTALAGVPPSQRTARFVCCMSVCDPDGSVIAESVGTYEGVIADTPSGANGFGYDPLLFLPDAGCTSAQLDPADKDARSHRGAAARALVEVLLRRGR